MTDDHSDTGKTRIPWDFQHWGDPEDYVGYDPTAKYVDTLAAETVGEVAAALHEAQAEGRIENVQLNYLEDHSAESITLTSQDARALLEIAETVDDMTQHERDSYDRVRQTLDDHDRHIAQQRWGDRNEDGMIRLPWRDKGPYVVQMSRNGETNYLSRAGMEDLGPAFDTIEHAAIFEVKNDARRFAAIADNQGIAEGGKLKVIPQREAVERAQARVLDQELAQSLDQSLNRGHHLGR
jgi:hypothetical protein